MLPWGRRPSLLLKGGEAVNFKPDFQYLHITLLNISEKIIAAGILACLFKQEYGISATIMGVIWWIVLWLIKGLDDSP